jgi:hypothetical protein
MEMDTNTSGSTNTRMNIALELQMKGWWIYPQHSVIDGKCTCNGSINCNPAKHPCEPRGWNKKRQNAKTHWTKYPYANIAVRTGEVSHILVLDVDGPDGLESLRKLEEKYGKLPTTLESITGNGRHLFFNHPGTIIKLSKQKATKLLGPGIELKCDGPADCITLPPSVHHSGHTYEWVNAETPIADCPLWLLDRTTTEDVKATDNHSDDILEGSRNNTMFGIVGGLFRELVQGDKPTPQEQEAVLHRALEINRQQCKPEPLSEAIIRSMVARIATSHNPSHRTNKPRSTQDPLIWYKFNVLEYFESQRALLDYQEGWRIRLQAYAWRGKGILVNDPDILYKLSGASSKPRFKKEMSKALFDFEVVQEGGQSQLVNFEMVRQHAEATEAWNQKSAAGRASARAKEQSRKSESKPNEVPQQERKAI